MAGFDGIFYSGMPVLLDIDDRVRAFFEQRWPPSAWPFAYGKTDAKPLAYPFFQKSRAGIFTSPYPECPAPGINELVIPTGASRYAKALVIVDREFLEAFIDDPTTGKWPSEEPRDFRIQYNDHAVVWGMYALTPIRCDATINANLWMLPLVDERYFWNRSYNPDISFLAYGSWQQFIDDIASGLGKYFGGGIPIVGGVSEAYGMPDHESVKELNSSLGNLLDVAAMSIGKRCLYSAAGDLASDGSVGLYPPSQQSFTDLITHPAIAERLMHGGLQCSTKADPPVALYGRMAFDYWGNADELEMDVVNDNERIGNHVIRCAWWYEHERTDYGYWTPMPATDAAWDAFKQQIQADMTAWGSYPFAATVEGVAPYIHPNPYIDCHSYKCERLRTGQMSVTTTITGLPPDFAPYVNIAQRPDVYVHLHEVARFTITEETNDYGYAKGLIIKSEGPYSEGEVFPIRILAEATEADIGKIVTCHYDHGRDGYGWREIKPQGENELVKFRTTSGIANRIANAVVLGGDNNGDTIELHDPNNLWPNITVNCIGFAKQRRVPTGQGSGSGSSGSSGSGSNPPANVRWEIVTCSLPANEIRVVLTDTLLAKTYSQGQLKAMTTEQYFLRSTYPDVMKPEQCNASATYEWDVAAVAWVLRTPCPSGCASTPPPPPASSTDPNQFATVPCVVSSEQIEIEFQNTWLLDGMCNSYAVLRRVTNAGWGSPLESSPDFGSATDAYWEIVQVERRKARRILFIYQGEDADPQIEKWWQGENPVSDCDDELEIEYPLGTPCIGDKVIADYDPKLDIYYGLASESAMLGAPITISPMINIANDPCGIEMTRVPVRVARVKNSQGECEFVPFETLVQMGVSTPVLLAATSESCGYLSVARQQARLWLCDSEIQVSNVKLNLGDKKFVTAASFGPRTCTGVATWTFNTVTNDWDLTTPCSSGCETVKPAIPVPLPTGTITTTTPCSAPANGNCGLNLTLESICEVNSYSFPAEVVHVPLPLQELIVSGEIYKAPGEIAIERFRIYVCNFEELSPGSIPLYTCPPGGGNGGGGSNGGGNNGGGNNGGGNCSGVAVWRYGVSTGMFEEDDFVWTVVSPCPNGCTGDHPADPGPVVPAEYEWNGQSWVLVNEPCQGWQGPGQWFPGAPPNWTPELEVGDRFFSACYYIVEVPCEDGGNSGG